jgi:hypothetical protein
MNDMTPIKFETKLRDWETDQEVRCPDLRRLGVNG